MDFENENRIMTPGFTESDHDIEISLRPKALTEYIGQEKVKENLKIYIEAAKNRGDTLDHVLLYGPPGLGKTTLAGIISNEMGVNIRITSGPAIERINNSVLKEVVLLDTIPLPESKKCDKITMLPVAPVFAEAIERIYTDKPMSAMFGW